MSLVAVVKYDRRHTKDLSKISVDELIFPLEKTPPLSINTVSDLGAGDHLVVPCSSKAFLRSHKNIRCKISLLLREPRAIHARYYNLSLFFFWRYFSVLTFDAFLLKFLPNAKFAPSGNSWVLENLSGKKQKNLSVIASKKRDLPGHRLRLAIVDYCVKNNIEIDLFGRAFKPIDSKEEALADYRFSIVIENSREENYFTEKIIDCFLQKVVPVYWGAPNIGQFFDAQGILVCESDSDLKNSLESLSENLYEMKKSQISKNFSLAKQYRYWAASAARAVLSIGK
jgi:hypothetical protein